MSHNNVSKWIVIAGLVIIIAAVSLFAAVVDVFKISPHLLADAVNLGGWPIEKIIYIPYIEMLMISSVACVIFMLGIRMIRGQRAGERRVLLASNYTFMTKSLTDGAEYSIPLYMKWRTSHRLITFCNKLGMLGLSLITIFLALFFAVCGLSNPKFYDLAQLMLGAFVVTYSKW